MRVVFNPITKVFSVYDNARDLAQLLSNSDTRKKLLEMGYDPSIKSKRIKDEDGNVVREYLGNDARLKVTNDELLTKVSQDSTRHHDQDTDRINKGNDIKVLYPFDPSKVNKRFKYHGYTMEKYTPSKRTVDINGVRYIIKTDGIGKENGTVDVSFEVDDEDDPYKVVNKPENIKPLSRALHDQITKVSPNKILFQGADDSDGKGMVDLRDRISKLVSGELTPDPEESQFLKQNMINGRLSIMSGEMKDDKYLNNLPKSWQKIIRRSNHKAEQREMMYDRWLNSMFPGIIKTDGRTKHGDLTYDMGNVNYDDSRRNFNE